MSHRTVQIIDHELENWLDLLLAVPSIVCERRGLSKSDRSPSLAQSTLRTHSSRSRMSRARYIPAAAIRLG